jgi:hypothetical protein
MIKTHVLDIETSKQLYKSMSSIIIPKHCYNNTWEVFFRNTPKFLNGGEWKIAFGYIKSIENLWARHAFIVTKEGKAIDVTAISLDSFSEDKDYEYISFKLLSAHEYIHAIEKNDNEPALFTSFKNSEKKAFKWAEENEYIFLGNDMQHKL